MTGVPGQLIRAMTHKIVGATARPNQMQCLFINTLHPQQCQSLHLVMAHAFAHVRRALHSATQLLLGGEIEFAQQALLPAVPQRLVGGADVSHRQADQEAQAILGLHLFGKLFDHLGILNIAPLGGNRHQQVMAYQPGNQLGFARIQPVQLGEFQHVLCTQY